MRSRLAALFGVLVLLALLLWFRTSQEVDVDVKGTSEGVAGNPVAPLAFARQVQGPSRLQAATIAGRVLVEDGVLPPAQVCVQPAELAQDRSGWARLSRLSLLERCVDVVDGGRYRIDDMLPGRWVVSASAEGYVAVQHRETPVQPWISLQVGQVREGLDLTLRVRGVAVRGVVRDVSGGTISGAVVTDGASARVLSDEDGRFTLWSFPRSSVTVAAYAAGYAQDVVLARPPQPPVILYLTPESVLRGRVVRSDTGAPLSGWAVHLHNAELADAETATDGSFELRGLAPGRHKPYVRSDGWCGSAEPSIALGLGETSDPITIIARPCRTLAAQVRVKPSGDGCAAAEIELLDAAGDVVRRASTDAAGAASLSDLDPGAYDVRIRCPGRLQRAPEPWVLGEAMQAEAIWYVEVGRALRGVVRDHTGAAAPRSVIEITGAWGHVSVDADDRGEFVATGIHPGAVTISPYHPQHGVGKQLDLEIAETSDPAPVVLEFPPATSEGVVSGRVRARVGDLPPGLTVAAYAIGNFSARSVRVDEDGRYTIPGLARLPHRVVVQRAGGLGRGKKAGELAEIVVGLDERESAEADFVVDIEGMVELAGRVENADGSAEPDALVTVTNSMSRHRTLTDEAGRFAVQVPGGTTYAIDVTARDGSTLQKKDVKPSEPLTLRLTATRRVCGVVTSEVPVTGSFTIDTDIGGGETFGGGDARWCLPQVPVGTRTIKARSQIFGTARQTLKVPAMGDVPEVSLKFAGRTSLRGRVLDSQGEPHVGLKVWVLDATGRLVGGNLYTDTAGEFAVDGVPAGELTVIPIPAGPFPGRDELMARGTKAQVSADQPADELVLHLP